MWVLGIELKKEEQPVLLTAESSLLPCLKRERSAVHLFSSLKSSLHTVGVTLKKDTLVMTGSTRYSLSFCKYLCVVFVWMSPHTPRKLLRSSVPGPEAGHVLSCIRVHRVFSSASPAVCVRDSCSVSLLLCELI